MTPIENRMAQERSAVRHLIRTAKAHGWRPAFVFDGEEYESCWTEAEAMDLVFSVDESRLIFKHPDHPKDHCAVVVLGNSGAEAIADHSQGAGWDEVMAEVSNFTDTLEY
jgi:hypothetical protein